MSEVAVADSVRSSPARGLSTALGVVSVLLWSSTVATSRSLLEHVDPLTAAAMIYGLATVLGWLGLILQRGELAKLAHLPRRFWLVIGTLFPLYMVCLYMALGLSVDRQQALGVGLINYLWPSLTLLLSVPILGNRARWWVAPGIALALGGALLANLSSGSFAFQTLIDRWHQAPFPYVLALAAAVLWGLYSNLTRRLAGPCEANPVPVLLLITVLLLVLLRWLLPAVGAPLTLQAHWSVRAVGELLYTAVFPTWLAYQFWDRAMRRGNMVLVASISYLAPLFSVILYILYLQEKPYPILWLGCVMIIAGAVICRYAVSEVQKPES